MKNTYKIIAACSLSLALALPAKMAAQSYEIEQNTNKNLETLQREYPLDQNWRNAALEKAIEQKKQETADAYAELNKINSLENQWCYAIFAAKEYRECCLTKQKQAAQKEHEFVQLAEEYHTLMLSAAEKAPEE